MRDYSEFKEKEIRIKKYGYGKVVNVSRNTFTFKVPVDDLKWEKLELDNKFLNSAKIIKDSESSDERFRISFIVRNFYKLMFSPRGRATRKEYFIGRLVSTLILLIPSLLLGYFIIGDVPRRIYVYLGGVATLFGLLTLVGTINLSSRRLHDAGYKGSYGFLFYLVMISLFGYAFLTIEKPLIFYVVLGIIYLVFELFMCCVMSDFDNKFGPCLTSKLDDDEHVDGRLVINKEGSFTNIREFTEKIKKDNKKQEEEIKQNEKVLMAEKKLLEKQKAEKEERKKYEEKREEKGESLKELSERIRKEAKGELEKNPERLSKLPEKEERNDNDFLTEMLAFEKIERNKLLKEYEEQYRRGEISKKEFERLEDELLK